MIDIVGKRTWFFLLSAVLVIVAAVSLAVFRLELGIDFSGGSELTVQFAQDATPDEVAGVVAAQGFTPIVNVDDNQHFRIRTDEELFKDDKTKVMDALTARFGETTQLGFKRGNKDTARETARVGAVAVAVASAGILVYLAFAFRRVPKPFHYGVCAVIALVHNVLIVLGVFSLLGRLANWEIDLALVTGILTVIGYAVNDSIVVFDRIRENHKRYPGSDFGLVVNTSLTETMSRSLITGMGVIFVLVALLLFVGPSIKNLVVTLIVGIISGTYTSIFIAAPLLYAWEKMGRKSPVTGKPARKPA